MPSAWTRRELERLTVARRRITVIPHAPAPLYADGRDRRRRSRWRARPHEGRRFILAVGTLEPRKNLARLIEAFELIAADDPDLRLVLAGAPGWRYGPILERARSSPVAERIVFAGYQPPAALATLTRASGAVAYVSIYEGFGMPSP